MSEARPPTAPEAPRRVEGRSNTYTEIVVNAARAHSRSGKAKEPHPPNHNQPARLSVAAPGKAPTRLKHIKRVADRSGVVRTYYVRGPKPNIRLPDQEDTPAFLAAYEAARLEKTRQWRLRRQPAKPPRSVEDLVGLYLRSMDYARLAPNTQCLYDRVMRRLLQHEDFARRSVAMLDRRRLLRYLVRHASTPAAAADLLKKLRALMRCAIAHGWRSDDPTLGIELGSFRRRRSWAAMEIAAFEARWAPGSRIDVRYFAGPQDDRLRRILLAHRFVVPVPPPSDAVQRAPAHADANAVAELDGACAMTNAPAVVTYDVANALADEAAKSGLHSFNCVPKLVASTATHQGESGIASDIGMRGLRRAGHAASKVCLAANSVPWWNWTEPGMVASHRVPGGGLAADVIVLAGRNGRDHDQALPDFAADVAAPSQPGCRGPPAGRTQLAAADLVSGRGGSGARSWSRAHTPVEPTDPVVIDNLGNRVPVGAAELAVIETYLDDVLRELIAAVEPRRDDEPS